MSRVWSLYKTLLNVQYNWSAAKFIYIKKRQRIWEPIVIVLGLAPVAVMLVSGLLWFSDLMYRSGMMFAQPHLLLAFAALASQVITLFFGVFYVLSAFYFSHDLTLLIPLPFRPWEVLTAKLLTIMTGQYLPIILTFVPAAVLYGVRTQAAPVYWLAAALVFLGLPVLPLIIATVLSVVLMRLVNMSRRKDLWAVIGGFALTFLLIGFQFYVQFSVGDQDPEHLMQQLLAQADGLVNVFARYFPPSVWAAKAMAYASSPVGWVNMLLYVGITAVGAALILVIADKVFYRGVISGMERGRRAKAEVARLTPGRTRPLVWSLALMEIRLFMRNPGFVLNGLIGYILFPVMIILPRFAPMEDGNPFALIGQVADSELLMGGVALFFVLTSAMSMIPATTFSREGKHLWFPRTLPLTIDQILAGRILGAQVINGAGALLSVIAVAVVFRFPPLVVFLGCVLGVLLSTSFASLLTILDLARPMLNWTNPVKAVKSNLNSVFAMTIGLGVCFGLGWVMYLLVQAGLGYLIFVELVFSAALFRSLYRALVGRYARARWRRIEA
ncbi:MAG: putative ABC transporter permease subunit [Limnochordia bacterium]